MSAALSWDAITPTDGPSRTPLRLVPTGRDARRGVQVRTAAPAAASPPVRISRFGRLFVSATVLVAAVMLTVTIVGAGSAQAGIDHTVTVTSGQTLSEIALRELPSLPMSEGVAQLQLANHLNTSEVHAGQALSIPHIG
ncbi:MAG: LysM peptidoglycan-binding domain-containing protein [Lapillicoccus sp.]